MNVPDDDDAPRFEASLQELEAIVHALESGELSLDEALTRYGRGVQLLSHCRSLLNTAEQSVALLTEVDEAGQPRTTAFDGRVNTERETADDGDDPPF